MRVLSSGNLMSSRALFHSYIVLLVFTILGGVLYFNALDNPFQYDDLASVVENRNIRDTDNILRFFKDPSLSANDTQLAGHYRPLVMTRYTIN